MTRFARGWLSTRCRRIIREEEPPQAEHAAVRIARRRERRPAKRRPTPAKLVAAVRGDLDWIVMKALEKDRDAALRDGQRAGAGRAAPPGRASRCRRARRGTAYKLGKFVRRHRFGVGSAAAAVLALLVFLGLLAFQARRLAAERDRANQEAATATQVTQFLISLFNVSDPGEARGNSLTAREVLDKGAKQLDETLRDQPIVRARLGTAIGTVYTNLGLYAAAKPLLERSVEVARASGGDDHPDTIAAMNALGAVCWYLRDYERSIELYQAVFDASGQRLVIAPGPRSVPSTTCRVPFKA